MATDKAEQLHREFRRDEAVTKAADRIRKAKAELVAARTDLLRRTESITVPHHGNFEILVDQGDIREGFNPAEEALAIYRHDRDLANIQEWTATERGLVEDHLAVLAKGDDLAEHDSSAS